MNLRVETTSSRYNHVSDDAFRSWTNIFDSGFIPDKTFFYDGNGTTNGVARMFVMSADTESVAHSKVHLAYDGSNLPSYMYTDSGIGVGVKIDCSKQKKFKVSRKFAGAYYGRMVVKVYGSDGVKRPETAGDVLVKSSSGVSWTPTYGGAWQQNSDLADDFYFEVGASVDSIALLQGYGSNPPRVTWMSIQSDGGAARVYTPFDHLYADGLVATAIPSSGNLRVGQLVKNAAPTAAGNIGLVCTASGSPGTWKTFGAIGA